ncbi:MAG: ABC transporter ATP-binding protein [Elusimicrobia bacterium CG08_land_8_20_14_0_20_59_10]|nr:MAG: ABC transporter ATP-binding protein [Elusimicrobia bacterium CG08_land_8_20_14_0_20_59_10]
MTAATVLFRDVEKTYRRPRLLGAVYHTAVKGLSFEIPAGEVTGLLGLNGAGKTTIMKLITGLLFPTAGSVEIFGLSPEDRLAKGSVGFLPELPYFPPQETPGAVLAYYGRLSGLGGAELSAAVEGALRRTGLEPHAGKRISEFSKGMLQRLGLAQALLHKPRLLVLDEPVSGLDPLAIHDIRGLLAALNAAGCTIFLSSHSISEVEKLCSRVLIMVRGSLARAVARAEWEAAPGGLEAIFVETVK